MNRVSELRTERARTWEKAKAFLDSHRNEKGILSPEDTSTYERMEEEIVSLGKEIEREERADAFERELMRPVNTPLTSKPESMKVEEKVGRATDSYKKAFWNTVRTRSGYQKPEFMNALQEGVDSEGGYLVPDEYEKRLLEGLREENIIRNHAYSFVTSTGIHKIPLVGSHGSASWIEEEGAYQESDDTFSQVSLDAHKVGTIIRVSEELLQDSVFDLESYIASEFSRRIGEKEEEAFITGNGTHKPLGILAETGGAEVGVTAAKGDSLTADELIDLYYSLKSPYRKSAIWILNDSTVKAIRKLKNNDGTYLWQPAIKDGEVNTILGRPYYTSSFIPALASGNKSVLFGDLSYYWIGDRQGISFKRLNELYAGNGQVGFIASKRVDGKLVLPEAVKCMKMAGTASSTGSDT